MSVARPIMHFAVTLIRLGVGHPPTDEPDEVDTHFRFIELTRLGHEAAIEWSCRGRESNKESCGLASATRSCYIPAMASLTTSERLGELLEGAKAKKCRRVAYHVTRGAKKFVFGTGNAAWVVGTSMLILVLPLVFEIDREQQAIEWEASMGQPQGAPKL